ncbi:NYN domain-containing protein [Crassisporium funariophilum]|nr:NYN domain-containing protein [Crassisporium funariophilum]
MRNTDDVAIFWDYENCPAPSNASGYAIVNNIRSVAQPYGSIKAFKAYLGVSELFPESRASTLRSELQSSGVSLIDCPHNGRKDVADKMILVDMLAHAIDNPAPSTIVLISGDRDFAYALSVLRLRRYRVILLTLSNAHSSLTAQATIRFDWISDILKPIHAPSKHFTTHAGLPLASKEYDSGVTYSDDIHKTCHSVSVAPDVDIEQYLQARNQQSRTSGPSSNTGFVGPSIFRSPSTSTVTKVADISPGAETLILSPPFRPFDSGQAISTFISGANVSRSAFNSNNSGDGVSTSKSVDVERIDSPSHEKRPAVVSPTFIHDYESPLPSKTRRLSAPDNAVNDNLSFPLAMSNRPRRLSSSAPPIQFENPLTVESTTTVNVTQETAKGLISLSGIPQPNPPFPLLVPPKFRVLVQCLQIHRQRGLLQPRRSQVGEMLAKTDTYQQAGVQNFAPYVILAQKEGIIELGGKDGGCWISLKPAWYNAILPSIIC